MTPLPRRLALVRVLAALAVWWSLAPGPAQATPPDELAADSAKRPGASRLTLTIAAAANLKPALDQAVPRFEAAHPDVAVQVTYGASGTFFAQLSQGAPFDLFLSADAEAPRKLADAGLTTGPARTYALGRLVLYVPKASPLDLTKGLAVLQAASVQKVAIGNPALAPYGVAAEQALQRAGLTDAVTPKLVLGQSVGQAAQFVDSGNAQAGLLPLSLAKAPPLDAKGRYAVLPPSSHAPIEQAGVVLKAAKAGVAAKAFFDWLLGAEGRALLEQNGYGPPP